MMLLRSQALSLFTHPVNKARSDGLDALRFILALWVVFAHGVPWAVSTGSLDANSSATFLAKTFLWIFQGNGETHPAVLVFIILSGYCIHRNGYRKGLKFSLKSYAIRRSFRILPIYWVGVILGVIIWIQGQQLNSYLVSVLTATDRITTGCLVVKITGISSFLPNLFQCSFEGNAPLTTAIVETWLYVFYGLVVFFARNGVAIDKIIKWAILGWATNLFVVALNPKLLPWWHNGSFFSFLLYWWIGAFFAEFKIAIKINFVVIAFACIALGFYADNLLCSEIKKIGISMLASFAIVWIDDNWKNAPILSFGGRAGYCIYALHAPMMVYMLVMGWSLWLVVFAVLIFSLFIHFAIENPFLEYGKRLSHIYS